MAESVSAIAAPFDLVLFDAYGVLNVGERPVPDAADCIAGLRRAGKQVMVVTNSAGYPKRVMLERYGGSASTLPRTRSPQAGRRSSPDWETATGGSGEPCSRPPTETRNSGT